jgi:hypothetical protein
MLPAELRSCRYQVMLTENEQSNRVIGRNYAIQLIKRVWPFHELLQSPIQYLTFGTDLTFGPDWHRWQKSNGNAKNNDELPAINSKTNYSRKIFYFIKALLPQTNDSI